MHLIYNHDVNKHSVKDDLYVLDNFNHAGRLTIVEYLELWLQMLITLDAADQNLFIHD